MGHEKFRIVRGEKIPWNDSDVVRQILNHTPKNQEKTDL